MAKPCNNYIPLESSDKQIRYSAHPKEKPWHIVRAFLLKDFQNHRCDIELTSANPNRLLFSINRLCDREPIFLSSLAIKIPANHSCDIERNLTGVRILNPSTNHPCDMKQWCAFLPWICSSKNHQCDKDRAYKPKSMDGRSANHSCDIKPKHYATTLENHQT